MAARILIVEDDADINEIIATHLARQGHTCTQAFSGSEALIRLDAAGSALPFDLVICDLMLPGASGEQIIDAVDFAISPEDMETLRSMEHLTDYGDYNGFPVFSGKPLA